MMQIRIPLYNAVIGKELKTRMRGWGSIILITVYMVVFAVIAGGFLIQQAGSTVGQASNVGVNLFTALASLQLLLVLLITPSSTAGAISGERQRQTWDLLLITRLSTFGIVWGKLVTGVAFNILLMFAALPIFSLVFLFGGVAPSDIFHVYLVTIVSAVLVGSGSILISSMSRRVAGAVVTANVAVLVLTVGLTTLTAFLYQRAVSTECVYNACHTPMLPTVAQFDPVIALVSALPNSSGDSYLQSRNVIHHAFLVLGTMPIWEAFTILSILLSVAMIAGATYFARSRSRWLTRGGS